MSRETKYTAIILKKQPYKEGDEIITFFTQEAGKIRALAKSVKLSKSKLQQRLQTLFLVNVILTQGNLPKITGAEAVEVFLGLRENLEAVNTAFYALEVVLKFTPDEEKNPALFNLLAGFLKFLDQSHPKEILSAGLAKFKINALSALGLGINYFTSAVPEAVFFSLASGGFTASQSVEAIAVPVSAYQLFLKLKDSGFEAVAALGPSLEIEQLQNLLSRFVEHQLERKIKSEKYLQS